MTQFEKTYRNPLVTVDIIIEINGGIVLIERKNPPYGWALPGGFVDYGESLEKAAVREAKEETSLEVELTKQFHTYSDPARDIRHHTITTVFIASGHGTLCAADDAKNAGIFYRNSLPDSIAFDHGQIIEDYFRYRKQWKKQTIRSIKMTKIGVILAGCGNMDGSEIHESVLTLLFLDKEGVEVQCMAPDVEQKKVVNHLTGKPVDIKRNVLEESARIARGNIKNIREVSADDLDGLILPGGAGPINNLSDFAEKGEGFTLNGDVQKMIRDMHAAGKPVGAICIGPVPLAKALQDKTPQVTIGTDADTAGKIESFGGKHVLCGVDGIHVDQANKLVTTPAYMIGPGIKEIAKGIEKLVSQVVKMAEKV